MRCEAWQRDLRENSGPSTAKSARAVQSGILGYAARWGALPTNPTRDRLMLAASARIGEALVIDWGDVDFDAQTVWVRHLVRLDEAGLLRAEGTERDPGRRLQLPRWSLSDPMDRWTNPRSGYPVLPDAFGYDGLVSHDSRKTSLTALDEAGLSPRVVADVAGHAGPSMTQKVYMVLGLVRRRRGGRRGARDAARLREGRGRSTANIPPLIFVARS